MANSVTGGKYLPPINQISEKDNQRLKGLSGCLRDDYGDVSMMRVVSMLVVLVIVGFKVWWTILAGAPVPWTYEEVAILTAIISGKVIQDKIESGESATFTKPNSKSKDTSDDMVITAPSSKEEEKEVVTPVELIDEESLTRSKYSSKPS